MDGGSSDFEIFDDPITKKIHECNYYHQDPYLVQLNKVVTLLYKFQKYFPAKEVKTSKKAELWKSKSDLIDLMNLDIPTYLRRKFSTEKF
jgi:hypothetical protein